MSHNISEESGRPEMAFVGEKPWHGLGTYVGDKEVTAAEMITAAGLDWEVALKPGYYQKADGTFVPNGRKVIVRTDTERVLGHCGDLYTPLQNKQAFEFMDAIIGKGRAAYHTAGALQHGERVWVLVKVGNGEGRAEVAKGDELLNFVLLSTGHNGGTPVDIVQTSVRVVCWNTLNQALSSKEKGHFFTFRHTRSVTARAAEVAEGLAAVSEKFKKFVEAGRLLRGENITRKELDEFLVQLEVERANEREDAVAFQARRDSFLNSEKYRQLVGAFESGPGAKEAGSTLWGALNAATWYYDHGARPRNSEDKSMYSSVEDARLTQAFFGSGDFKKHRALDLALQLAAKK